MGSGGNERIRGFAMNFTESKNSHINLCELVWQFTNAVYILCNLKIVTTAL